MGLPGVQKKNSTYRGSFHPIYNWFLGVRKRVDRRSRGFRSRNPIGSWKAGPWPLRDVEVNLATSAKIDNWVVVSNICYFHPYVGKIPILTHILRRGWFNHQLDNKKHLSRFFWTSWKKRKESQMSFLRSKIPLNLGTQPEMLRHQSSYCDLARTGRQWRVCVFCCVDSLWYRKEYTWR